MNAERFETIWVIPKLSTIVTRLKRQSDAGYCRLFSSPAGQFLQTLRITYTMKPSNDALSGTVAAWRDMKSALVRNLNVDSQAKLFHKDILNFAALLGKLTKKYEKRGQMGAALFGTNGSEPKRVTK
jgi:hypothetical protein